VTVILSKANHRLIRNATIYGGIFWSVLALGVAWILSWSVAPELSDWLHLAVSIPTIAYFIIHFVNVFRRWKKHKPVEKPD
jgi:membrane protein DedA with SNARE-associated domain